MAQRVQRYKGALVSPSAIHSTLRRRTYRGRQTMVLETAGTYFEPNFKHIARDTDLGRTELRLLFLSMGAVGKSNVIPYTQTEMARRLGVSRQAVQQAMQQLVQKALVLQDGHTYQLNSRLATHQHLAGLIELRRDEKQKLHAMGIEVEL